MYSCPTLEKSAVQPKTTSLCSSITVITLWCLLWNKDETVVQYVHTVQYIAQLVG